MHFAEGSLNSEYSRYIGRKIVFIIFTLLMLGFLILYSISKGAANIPIIEVARALAGTAESNQFSIIVRHIRLPQVLAAVTAGGGLAIAGAVMQSVLRNPLGSPFTLGISHAAAFGAAFAVMILDTGTMASSNVGAVTISHPYITTGMAFLCCLLASFFIVAVARMRGASPESMILAGVAWGRCLQPGPCSCNFSPMTISWRPWSFGPLGISPGRVGRSWPCWQR